MLGFTKLFGSGLTILLSMVGCPQSLDTDKWALSSQQNRSKSFLALLCQKPHHSQWCLKLQLIKILIPYTYMFYYNTISSDKTTKVADKFWQPIRADWLARHPSLGHSIAIALLENIHNQKIMSMGFFWHVLIDFWLI